MTKLVVTRTSGKFRLECYIYNTDNNTNTLLYSCTNLLLHEVVRFLNGRNLYESIEDIKDILLSERSTRVLIEESGLVKAF